MARPLASPARLLATSSPDPTARCARRPTWTRPCARPPPKPAKWRSFPRRAARVAIPTYGRNKARILALTRFLHANRCPLRLKTLSPVTPLLDRREPNSLYPAHLRRGPLRPRRNALAG